MELKPNILKEISSKVSLPHLFFTLIRCEQIDIVIKHAQMLAHQDWVEFQSDSLSLSLSLLRWPVRAVFTSKLHTSKFHIAHFQIPHCTLQNVILKVGKISKSTRATVLATVDTTNSRDGL